MATAICAISGLELRIPHVPMQLPAQAGYYHPIFTLQQRFLWRLYKQHCAGELSKEESYLLFLALLNSTDAIRWRATCGLHADMTSAVKLVERNINQLVRVINLTNQITTPAFKQPKFTVTLDTCMLGTVKNWIEAWSNNIDEFKLGRIRNKLRDSLVRTENRLTYFIRSGMEPSKYAGIVASWAAKAADFPAAYREQWIATIKKCFDKETMFRTNPDELRAIKEYCLTNIPSGSIHTHALYEQLNEGLKLHYNYLGMSSVALGYTIIDGDATKNESVLAAVVASAPIDCPQPHQFSSKLEYIKAKLAYQTKVTKQTTELLELAKQEKSHD